MGLIKKFSFFGFIKKRLTSSQVGPVRRFVLVGFVLILVVVSAYFLFFSSSEVLAEWWDTNWHYRKAITITNSGTAQTDFQVKILANYDMSADVTNGKVQADFDDLRFTDINGNALDYWIEDDTAASLDVWAKISSIPTITSTVYMYYGNPNVSAVQSGDDTFEFFDDFSGTSLSNYDQVGSDIWGITSGYAHDQTSVNVPGARLLVKSTVYQANDNFMIKIRARQNDNDGAGVVFRSSGGSYYTCNHITEGSGRLIISKDGGGYHTGTSLNYTSYAFVQTTFYTVEARVSGTSISCVANGSAGNVTVNTTDSSYSTGQMGLFAEYLDPYGEFDWLIIGKSATAIPTATPQSEEKGPGPVGYWSFDEGYGTTAQDRTSNNNDGTIAGATWQTEDQCIAGKCLFFDGSDDTVNVSNFNYPSTWDDAFSISTWIFVPSSATWSNGYYGNILSRGSYDGSIGLMRHTIDNYVGMWIRSDTTSGRAYGYITRDKWYHLNGVWDGEKVKLYLNGILQNETSLVPTGVPEVSSWYIGQGRSFSGAGGNWFNGFIDEPKIYGYARSVAQIKADYNSGRGRTSSGQGSSASLGGPTSLVSDFSSGLVGYWKMDEASGNLIDTSGNGNTGTAIGTTVAAGQFGNGRSFNGDGDYANAGNATSLDVDTLTASSWVKTTGTGYKMWMARGGGQYWLSHQSSKLHFCLTAGGVRKDLFATVNYYDNKWHHVVNTYDGAYMKMYMDGVEINSFAKTGTISGLTDLLIGRYSSSYQFTGQLDEVRIYNRALSEREIQQLYEYAPGPVGYYNFNENSGTKAYDKSGNGNSATLVNGPSWELGKFGSGVEFETGSSEAVSLDNSITLLNFTLESWVKANNFDSGIGFFARHEDYLNCGFRFGVDSSGYLRFFTTSSGGNIGLTSNNSIPLDEWHHVAVIHDGGDANIYIDGIEEDSTTGGTLVSCTKGTTIGGNYDTRYTFDGVMDDVRIYNYARTQKQILEDMNAGRPASKSPVGYWKFDEGADNTCSGGVNDACDSSEYGNDGSNIGADWTNAGKFGKALSFNGTSSYISVTDDNSLDFKTGDFSVSSWVKNTGNDGVWNMIATKYDATSSDGFFFGIDSGGHIKFQFYESGSHADIISTTDIGADSAWHHIVITGDRDSSTGLKAYLDGVEETYTTQNNISALPGDWNSSGNLKIGTDWNEATYHFKGSIDEVKVYNYALTEEEIKQEYNQGKVSVMGIIGGDGLGSTSSAGTAEYCVPGDTATCNPPVAEWRFDEKTGDYAYDTSGNGNTGNLTNMESVDWKSAGECHSGACLDFDGESEYVTFSQTSLKEATYSLWFNSQDIGVTSQGLFGDKDGVTSIIGISNNNTVRIRRLTTVSDFTFSSGFNNDEWYYFTLVATDVGDNVRETVYINGQNIGSLFTDDTTMSIDSVGIIGTVWDFNGKIDQVRIYDYARTPAQIAWDYNKGKPVAHWRFDEGQGTTLYDESDNNNDGTLSLGSLGQTSAGSVKVNANTAWYNGREGKQNYSLNFDGSDDYVDVVDPIDGSLDFGTNDFTISLWVKTTDTSGTVLSKSSGGIGYKYGLANGWGGTSIFWFEDGNNPGSDYTYVTTDITDGIWHHVVGIADHTKVNVQIYVDGVYDPGVGGADVSTAGSYNNNADLYIGYLSFNGQIDDVKVFNYALTEGQIKTEYNMGAARLGTGD